MTRTEQEEKLWVARACLCFCAHQKPLLIPLASSASFILPQLWCALSCAESALRQGEQAWFLSWFLEGIMAMETSSCVRMRWLRDAQLIWGPRQRWCWSPLVSVMFRLQGPFHAATLMGTMVLQDVGQCCVLGVENLESLYQSGRWRASRWGSRLLVWPVQLLPISLCLPSTLENGLLIWKRNKRPQSGFGWHFKGWELSKQDTYEEGDNPLLLWHHEMGAQGPDGSGTPGNTKQTQRTTKSWPFP